MSAVNLASQLQLSRQAEVRTRQQLRQVQAAYDELRRKSTAKSPLVLPSQPDELSERHGVELHLLQAELLAAESRIVSPAVSTPTPSDTERVSLACEPAQPPDSAALLELLLERIGIEPTPRMSAFLRQQTDARERPNEELRTVILEQLIANDPIASARTEGVGTRPDSADGEMMQKLSRTITQQRTAAQALAVVYWRAIYLLRRRLRESDRNRGEAEGRAAEAEDRAAQAELDAAQARRAAAVHGPTGGSTTHSGDAVYAGVQVSPLHGGAAIAKTTTVGTPCAATTVAATAAATVVNTATSSVDSPAVVARSNPGSPATDTDPDRGSGAACCVGAAADVRRLQEEVNALRAGEVERCPSDLRAGEVARSPSDLRAGEVERSENATEISRLRAEVRSLREADKAHRADHTELLRQLAAERHEWSQSMRLAEVAQQEALDRLDANETRETALLAHMEGQRGDLERTQAQLAALTSMARFEERLRLQVRDARSEAGDARSEAEGLRRVGVVMARLLHAARARLLDLEGSFGSLATWHSTHAAGRQARGGDGAAALQLLLSDELDDLLRTIAGTSAEHAHTSAKLKPTSKATGTRAHAMHRTVSELGPVPISSTVAKARQNPPPPGLAPSKPSLSASPAAPQAAAADRTAGGTRPAPMLLHVPIPTNAVHVAGARPPPPLQSAAPQKPKRPSSSSLSQPSDLQLASGAHSCSSEKSRTCMVPRSSSSPQLAWTVTAERRASALAQKVAWLSQQHRASEQGGGAACSSLGVNGRGLPRK